MPAWDEAIGQGPNRSRIVKLLRAVEGLGCRVEIPDGQRDDYVNIRPPATSRRTGRVASVHANSGSVEFQDGSWTRLFSPAGFRHLAGGDKAARTLDSDADLDAVIEAVVRELDTQPWGSQEQGARAWPEPPGW